MTDGLTYSVQAMGAAERRMEMIAANLANLNAAGFKRSIDRVQAFDSQLGQSLERNIASERRVDFTQGTLRATGEPFDFALAGKGFFTVEGTDGELYTRDGRFFVNDTGVLQTQEGLPVAWEGARGTIDPNGKEVTVDPTGRMKQGDTEIGQLRIVDFEKPERLRMKQGGFWTAPDTALPIASEAQVRQGHVEMANTSAVDELVAMIAVQRRYEMGTRVMSSIDQSYKRLTNPR